jgi:enoyl-CoA hydratase
MGDDEPQLLVEQVDHGGVPVAVLTLNRAEARNPVDEPTIADLIGTVRRLVEAGEVRAIVLTGAGEAFSSGGDLKKYQQMFRDPPRMLEFVHAFSEACFLLERSPVLTVAMVNGACLAGGMELALSCDLITIADEARIGDGHLRFGQSPGGGAQRLIRAIGLQRARYWLISGELFPAEVAVDVGLAVGRAPRAELRDYTLDLVAKTCRNSPLMMANIKKLVVTALNSHLDDGLAVEEHVAHNYATTSFDAIEGLNAFAQRRPPQYRGE